MLGVTRIYSRKVQYLLDDCRETRERITLVSHGFGRGYNLSSDAMMGELRADIAFQAFRPGIVDLPEDQIRASKNAITLPDARNDFDFFDWSVPQLSRLPLADVVRSWAAPPADFAPRGLHTAPSAQINLRPARGEYGAYNFGRPAAPSIYGDSTTSRHPSHDLETSSHLDSQDFSGIDLNLRLEEFGPGDESVEIGREAQVRPSREGSIRSDLRRRTGSLDVPEMEMGFEPIDLGLDFGVLDQAVPNLEERSRRESELSWTKLSTSDLASEHSVYTSTSIAARHHRHHPSYRSPSRESRRRPCQDRSARHCSQAKTPPTAPS